MGWITRNPNPDPNPNPNPNPYPNPNPTEALFTAGLTANGTQRCRLLEANKPTECPALTALPPPEPPRLVSFEVSDPDNGDAALSVGDVYLLRFDRDVDRAGCVPSCAGGREFVHRIFSLSAPLGSDYSG